MRLRAPRARDAGLSLVELMVAVLILSIAVVGLMRSLDRGARLAAETRDRALAGIVARNRAELLALDGAGVALPGRVRLAGREWRVEEARRATAGGFVEVTIRTAPADGAGPGVSLVTYAAAGG